MGRITCPLIVVAIAITPESLRNEQQAYTQAEASLTALERDMQRPNP